MFCLRSPWASCATLADASPTSLVASTRILKNRFLIRPAQKHQTSPNMNIPTGRMDTG